MRRDSPARTRLESIPCEAAGPKHRGCRVLPAVWIEAEKVVDVAETILPLVANRPRCRTGHGDHAGRGGYGLESFAGIKSSWTKRWAPSVT
jgi:hypothetical protein